MSGGETSVSDILRQLIQPVSSSPRTPWLPRPVGGRTDVEGWHASWRVCSCTYLWICVCMIHVHTFLGTLVCVSICVYRVCVRMHICGSSAVLHTHTHTHLSRRVRFSPNGTTGTRDISILKGDISQSESCSRVQHDHSDSLTATQAGRRTDAWDCGVQHNGNMGTGFQKTPVHSLWEAYVMFSVFWNWRKLYKWPH